MGNGIQEGLEMSESYEFQNRKKGIKRTCTPFYGAVKSKNEIYFQMASLFKEVTKGEIDLSGKWMDHILKSRTENIPGKNFMDNI
jgi:hypothetical protein